MQMDYLYTYFGWRLLVLFLGHPKSRPRPVPWGILSWGSRRRCRCCAGWTLHCRTGRQWPNPPLCHPSVGHPLIGDLTVMNRFESYSDESTRHFTYALHLHSNFCTWFRVCRDRCRAVISQCSWFPSVWRLIPRARFREAKDKESHEDGSCNDGNVAFAQANAGPLCPFALFEVGVLHALAIFSHDASCWEWWAEKTGDVL